MRTGFVHSSRYGFAFFHSHVKVYQQTADQATLAFRAILLYSLCITKYIERDDSRFSADYGNVSMIRQVKVRVLLDMASVSQPLRQGSTFKFRLSTG